MVVRTNPVQTAAAHWDPVSPVQSDRLQTVRHETVHFFSTKTLYSNPTTLWLSSEPTAPPGGDGHSSEMEDEDEEGGGGGEVGPPQMVPQTPDQEAFLKEHFVTLAERSSAGTASEIQQCHCLFTTAPT